MIRKSDVRCICGAKLRFKHDRNIRDAPPDCKTPTPCIHQFDLLLWVPMRPAKLFLALVMLLTVLQTGCSRQPKELSSEGEKLVPVYADLLMLSEELKSPRPSLDSAAYQQQVQSLLSRNGLTKEEFSVRMKTLAQSQEVFTQFQTKVHNNLEQRKSKQQK